MDEPTPNTETPPRITVQSVQFVLAGGMGGLTDLLVYSLLAKGLGWHVLAANLMSRPLGGAVSFLLNKYWTFGNRGRAGTLHQAYRYACLWSFGFAGSQALLALFHMGMELPPVPAWLAANATVGVVSFLCQKFWVFR